MLVATEISDTSTWVPRFPVADAVETTVIVRGILASLLVLGGVAAICFGYRVFVDRRSDGRSRMLVQLAHLKVTAQGGGAVIMATAVLWGWFGVKVSPNITTSPDKTEVFSFITPQGKVRAAQLPTTVKASEVLTDDELVGHFRSAVREFKHNPATIAGQAATFDLTSVYAFKRDDGSKAVRATAKSADATADLVFDALTTHDKQDHSKLVFQPTAAMAASIKPQ